MHLGFVGVLKASDTWKCNSWQAQSGQCWLQNCLLTAATNPSNYLFHNLKIMKGATNFKFDLRGLGYIPISLRTEHKWVINH